MSHCPLADGDQTGMADCESVRLTDTIPLLIPSIPPTDAGHCIWELIADHCDWGPTGHPWYYFPMPMHPNFESWCHPSSALTLQFQDQEALRRDDPFSSSRLFASFLHLHTSISNPEGGMIFPSHLYESWPSFDVTASLLSLLPTHILQFRCQDNSSSTLALCCPKHQIEVLCILSTGGFLSFL